MQTRTLLHWEDRVVMVCRGELVWTLLPILALARPCGCIVMVSHWGRGLLPDLHGNFLLGPSFSFSRLN